MDALDRYGAPTWFRLGDRDLATHLYRTRRLDEGATLTEVTAEIVGVLGRALPAAARCPTTASPRASRCVVTRERPRPSRCRSGSCGSARNHRSSRWTSRVRTQRSPVPRCSPPSNPPRPSSICPSNPVISIGPMLAVPGIRDALIARRDRVDRREPDHRGCAGQGPGRPPDGSSRHRGELRRRRATPTRSSAARSSSTRETPGDSPEVEAAGVRASRRRHADARRPCRGRPSRATRSTRSPDAIAQRRPADGNRRDRRPATRIGAAMSHACAAQDMPLVDGDCLVVTQKIVSKAEGRLVPLDHADLRGAGRDHRRRVGAGAAPTRRALRSPRPATGSSARTRVLTSPTSTWARGASPRRRRSLGAPDPQPHPRRGRRSRPRVIISDTFGRAWRHGLTDVAIGVAGNRRGRRPARRDRRPRSGAARHRGRDRRRDRERSRARDGQVHRASRWRSCADWTRHGSGTARSAELVRPAEHDLFR